MWIRRRTLEANLEQAFQLGQGAVAEKVVPTLTRLNDEVLSTRMDLITLAGRVAVLEGATETEQTA